MSDIIHATGNGLTIIDGQQRVDGVSGSELTDEEQKTFATAFAVADGVLARVSAARTVASRDPDVLAPMVADLRSENAALKAQIAATKADAESPEKSASER